MIKNDQELQVTLERIQHFYRIVANLRLTETNVPNYQASAGGFLAEIGKMNREVREYLSLHPSELIEQRELVKA